MSRPSRPRVVPAAVAALSLLLTVGAVATASTGPAPVASTATTDVAQHRSLAGVGQAGLPAVTVPSVTVPAVTVPSVTVPSVTVPSVTVPSVTVPSVTVPSVTVPSVTVPSVTVPAVTVPAVTTPAVIIPAITIPEITVLGFTIPGLTIPALTVPVGGQPGPDDGAADDPEPDDPAGDPAPPPADDPADLPADGPADPPADDPADDPADLPGDDPADNPADLPADDPADDPADLPADDPADDPADPPADEPADDPGADPAPGDEPVPGDEPAPGDDDPAGTPADDLPAGEDPAGPADPTAMPAITVEGDQILRGGEPWWFLGYNSFVWSGDCGNDDEKMTETDVENWFADMRHDGHGAVRLFFYDGWNLDRLDAAVESAQRHNIYLTITLDDAIGGCGENDKTADWFADQSERDVYQNHMEMLLERYRGNTTFAWFEYFNEPDYENGALREFFDEMGTAADRIDPDRLFSSGTVAPYWVDGEDNFLDIHQSPGVDIASLHEYDEGEIESNHGPKVRANSAGKPVIVGEYGITACEGEFDSRAERFAAKAEVYTDTDLGYAGAFAWAWQPGGGGCELGNLDSDSASQDVLREHLLDEAVARAGQAGDVARSRVQDEDPAGDEEPEADAEALTEGGPDAPG